MTKQFHELLERRAAELSAKPAYVFIERDDRERSLSFEALYRRASQVATLLGGVLAPGERVLLLFPPGLEFVPAFYGSMLAGTVSIAAYPPDPRLGAAAFASLQAIAQDAAISAVLAPRVVCQALAGKLDVPLVCFEDAIELTPFVHPARAVADDAVAYLQYTSGSTGSAKGVAITHRNLIAHCGQFVEGYGISREDRTVLWLPVHHSFGMFAGVVVPLYLGQTSIQMSPLGFLERPARWLAAISKHRGTVSGGPNFAFDLCARATPPAEVASFDLRSWRVAGLGGEPVRADTLRRFAAATAPAGFDPRAFRPSLGISEATLVASANPELREPLMVEFDAEALEHGRVAVAGPDTARRRSLVGLGRPLRGQTLVIQAEAGADIGEVWTAGDNIASGYWGRPEETARVFGGSLPGRDLRFLRTGDLGFLHRGELFLVGRAKDLVIVRGCNYHPHDLEQTVEASLNAPPQSVAAFAVDGPDGEELVVALEVEVAEGETGERLAAIAQATRAALSAQHNLRCQAVVCVRRGALPRTASAKLQRGECRRRYLAGELAGLYADAAAPPVDEAGEPATVLDVLARVLRVPAAKLDGEAPLVSLGLDSLAIVELHEIALEKLGVELPYERLLDPATRIRDLAAAQASAHGGARNDPAIVRPIAARVGLPDDLVPSWRGQPAPPAGPPRQVLVTGATGYLGAYIVTELLRQTTARVVCLVRGESPETARARLDAALARHATRVDPGWSARIAVHAGDFTEPRLGLPDATYEALSAEIDTVVHSGAWVNFLFPYAVLEPANIGGVEQVLRFVAHGRPKALHHLSSTAVLFSPGYERGRAYPEQHPLASDGVLPNGYEQTKWVADRNIELARERGFVISNYRVGYVTGASDDGRDFRLAEFFPAMIKGCIQLGVAPRLDTRMTMVPIDYTAAAIVRILARPEALGATYHINHPAPLHFDDVVRWINERGYPLATEPFEAWRARVTALTTSAGGDNALRPYLGFVRNLEEQHVWLPEIDCSDTRAAVAPLGCPDSYQLLATYFELFNRTGFLAPPRADGRDTAEASRRPSA